MFKKRIPEKKGIIAPLFSFSTLFLIFFALNNLGIPIISFPNWKKQLKSSDFQMKIIKKRTQTKNKTLSGFAKRMLTHTLSFLWNIGYSWPIVRLFFELVGLVCSDTADYFCPIIPLCSAAHVRSSDRHIRRIPRWKLVDELLYRDVF